MIISKKQTCFIYSPQLGLSPTSALGGEVYDREIIIRLARAGHQVKVLLPQNRPYDRLKNLRVSLTPLTHIPAHLYNLFWLPHAIKLARTKSFDLLRIHVPEFFGPGVWFFKQLFPHIPVVGHYHLDEDGFLFNLINRLFLNSCDLVIADSRYLAKQIKNKFHISARKITVIHCGTDVDKIKPGKKDFPLVQKWQLTRQIVILYLGLFIKRKNPAFLIKVFARLKKLHPNIKLIMIGKGPEENNLKILARRLKVSQGVIFPGPQYGKDKLKYYQTADIFAFPSHNEGFVLSILEAMAAGLPLVVPNTVSFPEAVTHGSNGYLCRPNHLSDWTNKLSYLIAHQYLRQKLSTAARRRALKDFTWALCNLKVIQAYQGLINFFSQHQHGAKGINI